MAADLHITMDGTPTPVYLGENATLALLQATRAEAAADAAAASEAVALAAAGPNYADTAAGLSATNEGETFAVEDDGIVTVYRHDSGPTATELRVLPTTAALASPTGAGMSGYGQSTVAKALPLTAARYGAVGDGVADDTAALKALLAEMKATGREGVLGSAEGAVTRYLITPGELEWTFTNEGADFAGPKLHTLGQVVLVSDGTVDAPLLSIHNDPNPPPSGAAFIEGGFVGDLRFEDTSTGGTEVRRHGIELYGINSMRFGVMSSTAGLRGDLIYIAPQGEALTGDSWHVWNCHFEGARLQDAPHYAFTNASLSQFFNYNHIAQIWALGAKGAFRGVGAANRIDGISVGWCTDIGVDIKAEAGSTQFCHIGFIECDSPRYGVRVSGIQHCKVDAIRFIYRNGDEHGSLGIPAETTWPELALEFTDADVGQVVSDFTAGVYHRFNDITSGQLPSKIVSYGDTVTHRNIKLSHRTTGLSPSHSLFRHDINGNTRGIEITVDDVQVCNTNNTNLLIARCTTRSGGSAYDGTTPVDFDSIQIDQAGAWDAANKQWVCQASGVYAFRVRFLIAPDSADLVRLGLFLNSSNTPFREERLVVPTGLTSTDSFRLQVAGYYPFTAGDTVKIELYEAHNRALQGGNAGVGGNNYFEIALV